MKTENKHIIISGELALILVVVMNSLGVVLMLYSGSGISLYQACLMLFLKL